LCAGLRQRLFCEVLSEVISYEGGVEMNPVTRVLNALEKVINLIIVILLMVMTMVIFYQVILRYVFHHANIWAEELARYSFIWVVCLGSASALRHFNHIRIDFLVNFFPKTVQKWIRFVNYILIMGFLVTLIYYGIQLAQKTAGHPSPGLGISTGFMYMSVPVGCILMLIFALEIIVKDYVLTGKKNKKEGGSL
jgi:C4-dicarboxylate transporter DctQ subunit